ncbi:SLC13 family permease [Ferrimonas gelatinilytica]|uniref:SLC13 family permease n=1 Tax=Ferrimonas gelatinilytica TaxID=1255257 RepID=A0ABP9RUN8_9GAMM
MVSLTMAQGATLALMLALVLGLVLTRIRPQLLFATAALLLAIGDLVPAPRLLELAANPAVITLLILLLISAALEKTGVLALIGRYLFRGGYTHTLARMGAGTILSSALLNNTAVVATMAGAVQRQRTHLPSRLLLPLSYAAILGGTLTLIGTSTHLVVNSVLSEQGRAPLALFDFLPVGAVVALAGLGLLMLLAPTLPVRAEAAEEEPPYFIDAEIAEGSPLIGRSVEENGLRALPGMFLAEVVRQGRLIAPVTPDLILADGDKLVFCGAIDRISELDRFKGLSLFAGTNGLLGSNLIEVLLSPTSSLVGQTLKQSDFRARFDAAVVAMRRRGERLSGKLGNRPLQGGDILVLATGEGYRRRRRVNRHFYQIGGTVLAPGLSAWQEWLAIGGFAAVLASHLAFGVPLLLGLGVLLTALLASGVLTGNDIRQRFPFELWVIITGALAMAEAFHQSGLAADLAFGLQAQLQGSGLYVALAGVYFVALLVTELMTNNAAAALVLPLALGLADAFGVSAMPFIMVVAYGASASFISPFSYQTHLMVMNLGNYRKRDYLRLGLPLSLLYSTLVLLLVPRVFPF